MANTRTNVLNVTCPHPKLVNENFKAQNSDQWCFKSLKSNFEDRNQPKEITSGMPALKPKGEFSRPSGTKVSTIAHMFQSLSQQQIENVTCRSPIKKDCLNHSPVSDVKVEKVASTTNSKLPLTPTTCSLSRRGSHLARFNNAKAMFEKLEEKTKPGKQVIACESNKKILAKPNEGNQNARDSKSLKNNSCVHDLSNSEVSKIYQPVYTASDMKSKYLSSNYGSNILAKSGLICTPKQSIPKGNINQNLTSVNQCSQKAIKIEDDNSNRGSIDMSEKNLNESCEIRALNRSIISDPINVSGNGSPIKNQLSKYSVEPNSNSNLCYSVNSSSHIVPPKDFLNNAKNDFQSTDIKYFQGISTSDELSSIPLCEKTDNSHKTTSEGTSDEAYESVSSKMLKYLQLAQTSLPSLSAHSLPSVQPVSDAKSEIQEKFCDKYEQKSMIYENTSDQNKSSSLCLELSPESDQIKSNESESQKSSISISCLSPDDSDSMFQTLSPIKKEWHADERGDECLWGTHYKTNHLLQQNSEISQNWSLCDYESTSNSSPSSSSLQIAQTPQDFHLTFKPKTSEMLPKSSPEILEKKCELVEHLNQPSLYLSGGESLAECQGNDFEFVKDGLSPDDYDQECVDSNYLPVDTMTPNEEEKFLSPSEPHTLLSDEEAKEVVLLLCKTAEKMKDKVSVGTPDERIDSNVSVVYDGLEYYFFEDGHYYYERPGLSPHENDLSFESSPLNNQQRKTKIMFSTDPIKVFSTHSTDEYDRKNEDVDPIAASAEYELEKRIEKMDVFPVNIIKGPEGLGLSIIGMGVGADAGVEKLGIFVKTVIKGGAADKDGRIKVNDQIIEVDGKSLVGVTQSYAATVLRNTSGHVAFEIGREKEGTTSEIAQLISQSLVSDKEQIVERETLEEEYANEIACWHQISEGCQPAIPFSNMLQFEDPSFAFPNHEFFSPGEIDVEILKLALKKMQYKAALYESELKKMKENLSNVDCMENDYKMQVNSSQCLVEEISQKLEDVTQELFYEKKELNNLRIQCESLQKKYGHAKKIIKEYQRREQEYILQHELNLSHFKEKDEEYNSLVKALRERISLLEQTLNGIQRTAGLPVTLPYSASLKQMSLHQRPPIEHLTCLSIHVSDISDSESSQTELSSTEITDKISIPEKASRDQIFDQAVPHTILLDSSAAKAKAELVNKGSLANRQPPSCKRQTGLSSVDEAASEKMIPYDIFIDTKTSKESPENYFDAFSCDQANEFFPASEKPLTLMEEMKAAVAARQARINCFSSDEQLDHSLVPTLNSSEEYHSYFLYDSISQSSVNSNTIEISRSCSSIVSSSELLSTSALSDSLIQSSQMSSTSPETSPQKLEIPPRTEGPKKSPTKLERSSSSGHILGAPVHEWTSQQVGHWLLLLGLEHHITHFMEADVTGQILLQIDSSRLKSLGVVSSSERASIKKKVKEMRSQLEKERKIQEKEFKIRDKLLKKVIGKK